MVNSKMTIRNEHSFSESSTTWTHHNFFHCLLSSIHSSSSLSVDFSLKSLVLIFFSRTQSWNRFRTLFVKVLLERSLSRRSLFSSIIHRLLCRLQVQHLSRLVCTNYKYILVRTLRRRNLMNFNELFEWHFSFFAWNFIDVYLIIISILLTEKFACINRKLSKNHRIKSSHFWNEMWCAYKVSVDLVERTNKLNGGTILISFFSNLYFICVQLLGCFKSESSLLDGIYLWFSLIFLIGRTLAVCWFASQINDESKKPLQILRSIHSDYFDVTMKRFTEQLVSGKVALTGMNFFYLTRKLILSVSHLREHFSANFIFVLY